MNEVSTPSPGAQRVARECKCEKPDRWPSTSRSSVGRESGKFSAKGSATTLERFWRFVEKTDCCWIWRGPRRKGYGIFNSGHAARLNAHRFSLLIVGRMPPPHLEIDHLCRNRACVNPAHLEAVTQRENVLRGDTLPAKNIIKTKCVHGHTLSGGNLYVRPDGSRECNICNRDRQRRRRASKGAI